MPKATEDTEKCCDAKNHINASWMIYNMDDSWMLGAERPTVYAMTNATCHNVIIPTTVYHFCD